MNKKTATEPDNSVETASQLDRTSQVIIEMRSAVSEYRNAAHLVAIGSARVCPIFYRDEVLRITLPWADVDNYQKSLLNSRKPPDEVFLLQLFDLLPTLEGKVLLDVGGFTGLSAVLLAKVLNPKHVHIFEPQKTMQDALVTTIKANDLIDLVTLHQDIIGEDAVEMELGKYRPDRLSETNYINRRGGKFRSVSIDSLALKDVGYINLNFMSSKIPALRGAIDTIKRCRPIICIDLNGRDGDEVANLLAESGYMPHRVGASSILFLP